MHPLERYLDQLRMIRSSRSASSELSYYPALMELLNTVGSATDPQVVCVGNIRNIGSGHPDAGLFTVDQLGDVDAEQQESLLSVLKPARGVVEVKGSETELDEVLRGEQITRYLSEYGQVLVTNYRSFVLLEERNQSCSQLEGFALTTSESEFWGAETRSLVQKRGDRFLGYLRRVFLHTAPLTSPRDVAWFLASYAREARYRLSTADLEDLGIFRHALEDALDIHFEGREGDDFFRSTLVQTLFYGVFSAWVLWHRERHPDSSTGQQFDWRTSAFYLHVPVLRKLFHIVADPGQLEELRLRDLLDWTGDVLNRVDESNFFMRFEQDLVVPYFYEPFLEAFDPELRARLGVWYTPPEVIKYMVGRVDKVLRTELGIADGLADSRVYVLDPACGTGAYLIEVLRVIEATLAENGGDALVAADLKRAATERLFGFEILPASFVIAHLQVELFLHNHDIPLSQSQKERPGIFLTNALTGWSSGEDHPRLPFPELEAERELATEVKQEKPILVVLGNPPYRGFAGLAIGEERALSESYRKPARTLAPQGQGLNDLYVRFFRMAERRIVEMTGQGAVCFITNYSWLDGLSHPGMRERFLDAFDAIWIDNLNGDKYRTGKLTPEGEADPSIFSTKWSREGIQVGTAITLLVRGEEHRGCQSIRYRELWGRRKREELVSSLDEPSEALYREVKPSLGLGLMFMPTAVSDDYFRWPRLQELLPHSFPGVKTSRDSLVVDLDRDALTRRLEAYCDPTVSDQEMQRIEPRSMETTRRFDARTTRRTLIRKGFQKGNITRYCYRPFDLRWIYWEPDTKLLDEKRAEYKPHATTGNVWIEARQKQTKENFDRGYITNALADNFGNGLSSFFPLYLRSDASVGGRGLFDTEPTADLSGAPSGMIFNVSQAASAYLESIGGVEEPSDLFYHVISVLHSPAYRQDSVGALRQDWPRIPLPESRDQLVRSASLGRRLAALMLTSEELPGVSVGPIRDEFRSLSVISRVGGGPLRPAEGELALDAGWGYVGAHGAIMPGHGTVVNRAYLDVERQALEAGAERLGLAPEELYERLGSTTYDVFLNETAFWRNIPDRVWEYTLAGYQVIKKWLSYRDVRALQRSITPEEAREVTALARRVAGVLLLEPALNTNYRSIAEEALPLSAV